MINIYRVVSSLPLLFVTLSVQYEEAESKSEAEAKKFLDRGNSLLGAGQLVDALSQYNLAIENDPDNYMAYYKRATVYLALGKSKAALPDLEKSMKLKPDFTAAIVNRGNILLKMGKLKEARAAYEHTLRVDQQHKEALDKIQTLEPFEMLLQEADKLVTQNKFAEAADFYSRVIMSVPWDATLREKRAKVYMNSGEVYKALDDYRAITQLVPDSTDVFYKMSSLHYQIGDLEESLTDIRECLKLDQDHKVCKPHYRKVKKLTKQLGMAQDFTNEQQYDDAIDKYHQALETESQNWIYTQRIKTKICHCHSKAQHTQEALKLCGEIIEKDGNNVDALIDRAEAHIQNEMYDDAINDYQRAKELEDTQRTQDGLQRAQKLLKQSQKRDYYKILGVKRNARKKEINKAYRKLAMEWHPDKHEGEEKKKAEKMFMDIAAAKEVLTDPDMRQKFDNGEDPLDPEEQQQRQQWGNPFGFNPFGSGGGGHHFKFHFN
ncbi:dnaJ homolog subfamily C member 3-like [Amphiura filiformis]|uniref:dnaJ homolog subfamily C member 3-like n=1 Tax=Amphiura filiformis TaxID=82378 RepID=UPI003B218DE1